ncbi:unnamed protein product, partial [Didymodactylos carnosus]
MMVPTHAFIDRKIRVFISKLRRSDQQPSNADEASKRRALLSKMWGIGKKTSHKVRELVGNEDQSQSQTQMQIQQPSTIETIQVSPTKIVGKNESDGTVLVKRQTKFSQEQDLHIQYQTDEIKSNFNRMDLSNPALGNSRLIQQQPSSIPPPPSLPPQIQPQQISTSRICQSSALDAYARASAITHRLRLLNSKVDTSGQTVQQAVVVPKEPTITLPSVLSSSTMAI